jgi:hypothetical protein
MHQSGKIAAYSSTALSAAAILGAFTLSIATPRIATPPDVKPAETAAPQPEPAASSKQDVTQAEQPSTRIEEVRALAETIAGNKPTPDSQPPALEVSTPAAADPMVAQPAEAVASPPQWSETEVAAALMECVQLLAPIAAEVVPLAPLRYNDCGTPAPVLLRSVGSKDKVAVDPPLLMNCPMVVALNRWLDKIVQPAARATLGAPVTRIVGSSYACRNLYNLPNERRSQHAFANAVDLPVFFLADGRRVDLATGWGPTQRDLIAGAKLVPIVAKTVPGDPDAEAVVPAKAKPAGMTIALKVSAGQAMDTAPAASKPDAKTPVPDPLSGPGAKFLRRVHQGACEVFTTVLGPEANDVHRTHLHLDLQNRNSLNVCE